MIYVLMMGSNCSGVGSQDLVTKTLHPERKGEFRADVSDLLSTNLYFFSVSLSLIVKSEVSVQCPLLVNYNEIMT